jgi:hypothetical protein
MLPLLVLAHTGTIVRVLVLERSEDTVVLYSEWERGRWEPVCVP